MPDKPMISKSAPQPEESEAHRIVEQAHEEARGIVARAREDAEQLLADAHADAAEFDAWARRDAKDSIRGEVAALHEALATHREELDVRLAALAKALDDTVETLSSTARLPSLLDQPEREPADPELLVSLLGVGRTNGQGSTGPQTRMSLVGSRRPGDSDHHPAAGPHQVTTATETTREDGPQADGGDAVTGSSAGATSSSDAGTLVRSLAGTADASGATVHELGDGDTITIDDGDDDGARDRDEQRPHDDDSRPLGWLFRSPS